ncbi:predicted protein [Verticillium alfalfae VaMs.102]|uniref:Predicted protein n=1 Tax=Verticillium alfalfae (strain VaMs.102 / ATCC MYA-4576 / FGSC 10136) TaxID=526221 RepID=C9SJJ0_VERA1|nr:predicted protein [Verticillium alfalfae VaMs.102]EEY18352.1 predicted protein [Verticillium alfalfae VaMs.102]
MSGSFSAAAAQGGGGGGPKTGPRTVAAKHQPRDNLVHTLPLLVISPAYSCFSHRVSDDMDTDASGSNIRRSPQRFLTGSAGFRHDEPMCWGHWMHWVAAPIVPMGDGSPVLNGGLARDGSRAFTARPGNCWLATSFRLLNAICYEVPRRRARR